MTSPITIVTGQQGSGKTTTARRIGYKYKQPYWANPNEMDNKFCLSAAPIDTDVLIIDDFSPAFRHVSLVKRWIGSGQITVHRQYQEPTLMQSPDVVLITTDAAALAALLIQSGITHTTVVAGHE